MTTAAVPLPLFTLLHGAGLPVLVETATGAGDLAHAAGDIFDTVITMEADKVLYEAAHERLSGRKGILPLHGDAADMVPNLLPRLARPGAFWLNAPPRPGEALPRGLAAILADPRGHVVCLPHLAASDPDLAAALATGAAHDVVTFDGVCVLVPRDNTALRKALAPSA
ncbi:hypothetical protein [Solidesulfovibrio alcoholivorans]|uniref:hypothetical protein n=1 Tax=Solidesulfovibrio alcoholivorans TaxID=81406 RepID=UPI000694E75A|nr:hypothetical protein [Solidesulfovibrio alcoholivorans]